MTHTRQITKLGGREIYQYCTGCPWHTASTNLQSLDHLWQIHLDDTKPKTDPIWALPQL